MVQARSTPLLKLTLTPLRIADMVPQDDASSPSTFGVATEPAASTNGLVVYPGEPSEMLVQVKNLAGQALALNLKVEGNFPAAWCRVGTEGRELAIDAQMDAVLLFQIPKTFFEDQQALHPQRTKHLKLKYHVLITVEAGAGKQTEIHQAEFELYVRPRSLYLDFLPVLYREVDFMGRFLKIFEQSFEPAVQSLDVMWANLDPLTAPQALLPFLAHWVGWRIEPGWSLDQQRRLIRQAVELYRWRGTRKGLRLYLHWYTGLPLDESVASEAEKHISITEPFGPGLILNQSALGEGAILGGGQPFHFHVQLRADRHHPIDRLDETIIRNIIEQEKPAFCTYELTIDTL